VKARRHWARWWWGIAHELNTAGNSLMTGQHSGITATSIAVITNGALKRRWSSLSEQQNRH
jgi:hypothetical protein